MAKILLIDDDEELCATISRWLSFEHHLLEVVNDGESAMALLRQSQYDLIILDLTLPDVDGIAVCQRIRSRGAYTPILMLTGRSTLADKVEGFDAGADDYLTKPFQMKELSLRLKALLRRSGSGNVFGNVLETGNLVLNTDEHCFTKTGAEVQLTPKEFALLELFMRNPRAVFPVETLLDRVWPSDSDSSIAALRTCIKELRKKIDDEGRPSMICNIHGVGYKFEAS